ncbi:expressed unknown protein [Seminavis robusta]|uniref:Uncharacterized protein n=1 Tax=Seminavis robusta TaxID=568900 RepID=A0A9N8DRW1_9STRA|nr:expressed unknown protein [Seminavis robusta]|eukprot:Sro308_g113570.1 n/a (126) ;mRNA; r:37696-38073
MTDTTSTLELFAANLVFSNMNVEIVSDNARVHKSKSFTLVTSSTSRRSKVTSKSVPRRTLSSPPQNRKKVDRWESCSQRSPEKKSVSAVAPKVPVRIHDNVGGAPKLPVRLQDAPQPVVVSRKAA